MSECVKWKVYPYLGLLLHVWELGQELLLPPQREFVSNPSAMELSKTLQTRLQVILLQVPILEG